MSDERAVILHGFEQDELLAVLRAVKAAVKNPGDVAFATSTETNKEWKLSDLLKEVWEEHEYMKANPPVRN